MSPRSPDESVQNNAIGHVGISSCVLSLFKVFNFLS